MTSNITTNFELDLPTLLQGQTYQIIPTSEIFTINGIFGGERIPVMTVNSYLLHIQSIHFQVEGNLLILQGSGLNET